MIPQPQEMDRHVLPLLQGSEPTTVRIAAPTVDDVRGHLTALANAVALAGVAITITISPMPPPTHIATRPAKPSANPAFITALHRRIIAALNEQPPRKGTWIAAKLGRMCGGAFRGVLAEMVKRGLIVRGADGFGYTLPAKKEQAQP